MDGHSTGAPWRDPRCRSAIFLRGTVRLRSSMRAYVKLISCSLVDRGGSEARGRAGTAPAVAIEDQERRGASMSDVLSDARLDAAQWLAAASAGWAMSGTSLGKDAGLCGEGK